MKFVSVIIVLFVLLFNVNLNAGFIGTGENIDTVAKVKYAEDGKLIILTGHIVKKIGDQEYLFSDTTGEIKVQIDNGLWGNIEVRSNTLIRIYGELGNGNLGNVDMVISRVEVVSSEKFGNTDVEID
jgi:uncharacterized protein (TIGR00156 family)